MTFGKVAEMIYKAIQKFLYRVEKLEKHTSISYQYVFMTLYLYRQLSEGTIYLQTILFKTETNGFK